MQDQLGRTAQSRNVVWIVIGATALLLISNIGQWISSKSDNRDHLICEDMGSSDPKSEAYSAKVMECLKNHLAQSKK